LFFPFTNDCDHLRRTLDLIEADDYAKLSDKEPAFGTRIGAALTLAAQSCEPERTYRPVIVLLSDGDDPADDDEWLQGVDAARARGTPVHVVGFGNPAQPEPIVVGRDLLEYEGEVVRTRLNEPRLQKIAERTGGEFFPAHRQDKFPLGALLLNLMDANGPGEDEGAAGATLPIYQLRYVWFLLPALILFFGTMLLGDGQRAARGPMVGVKNKAPVLAILLAAIVTISAADPPALEALIGQADQAFAQGDFEAAISLYEKTEGLTEDPGRIAFNKAAAYYRLERYREAIECYRRTLEDDQAPPERRARACFDLGNAIVKQADGSAEQLAEAVAAYRAALHLAEGKASWRADARHNLELAQLLLNKARAENPEKVIPKAKPDKPKTDHEKNGGKGQKSVLVPVDPGQGFGQDNTAQGASGQKSEHLQTGAITVLPDSSTIMPRSPEDTLAALQQEARRIRDARRLQQNPPRPAHLTTKDW
jgi:Ca-activated chloride channel family protein